MAKFATNGAFFKENPHYKEQLEAGEPFLKAMESAAAAIVSKAKGLTPVEDGDMRDSIHVVRTNDPATGKPRVHVASNKFYAHLVEFGGAFHPPTAPIRRGVTDAGYRFVPNNE